MTDQPQRKDAVRNRERILQSAKALFAERGLAVTLHEIAARTGVGVGTIYRHFPKKAPLIDEIFAEQLAELTAIFEEALGQEMVMDIDLQYVSPPRRRHGVDPLSALAR